MPPLSHIEERRGMIHHQSPLLSSPVSVIDIHVLSESKVEQLCRRKCLHTELERRRKVKFSTVKTELLEDVPMASQMLEEEKSKLWWSKEELSDCLRSISRLMDSLALRPRNYNNTEPYHVLLYRIEEACKQAGVQWENSVNEQDIKLLASWHRNSLSKRGLEKLVLDSHQHNLKVRETILHASASARQNPNIDVAMKEESIRVCSERLTRPSRFLAMILGAADAACVYAPRVQGRSKRGSQILSGDNHP